MAKKNSSDAKISDKAFWDGMKKSAEAKKAKAAKNSGKAKK